MAGLPPILIWWQVLGCNIREIWWKITRFHSPWVGLRPSLRLGEFGEEFGGHCLPSYRVACRTIAVAPHHCLAPTTPEWWLHQKPHHGAHPPADHTRELTPRDGPWLSHICSSASFHTFTRIKQSLDPRKICVDELHNFPRSSFHSKIRTTHYPKC